MQSEQQEQDDGHPPPSVPAFIVGPDSEGHWLAVEVNGRGGGLFASRLAAERFAAAETAHRAGAIRIAADPASLKLF